MHKMIQKVVAFLRRRGSSIAYYACVAAALCIIAWAADGYRRDEPPEEIPMAVPAAVEILQEREVQFTSEEELCVLREYAAHPVWDEYLSCWRTHPAVDISFKDNIVTSMSDGTVSAVGKSGAMGGFIEIESGEYLIRYASMYVNKDLEPGDRIAAGMQLGIADTSMPAESCMDAHVHLELEKNGEQLDFLLALNQSEQKD